MKLTEIVVEDAIVPSLAGAERDDVLRELVQALIAAGKLSADDEEQIVTRLLDRERRGSTGFGRGVAVPHVKHDAVESIVAAVGLSQKGVDFAAMDKKPVYSIVLLVSPDDRPEEHLQAMEAIFASLSKEDFRRELRQAESREAIVTLLGEADSQHLAG
ncbi:MAG: PTS sugar transporter subunit IIA [Planctomycetota bacterium]